GHDLEVALPGGERVALGEVGAVGVQLCGAARLLRPGRLVELRAGGCLDEGELLPPSRPGRPAPRDPGQDETDQPALHHPPMPLPAGILAIPKGFIIGICPPIIAPGIFGTPGRTVRVALAAWPAPMLMTSTPTRQTSSAKPRPAEKRMTSPSTSSNIRPAGRCR